MDHFFNDIFGDMPDKTMGIFMQAALQSSGNVAPNTIGADYFFLENFVTDDMRWDIPYITKDFLQHCYNKIPEFNDVGWYFEDTLERGFSDTFLGKKIMRLIYNGAKLKDEYCRELIIYLYKTYHKKEYNQLKRFKSLSADDVLDLVDSDYDFMESTAGRILGMSTFLNIKQEDSCSVIYLTLEKQREKWLEYDDEQYDDSLGYPDEIWKEAEKQVQEWEAQEEKKDLRRQHRINRKDEEFVSDCFKYLHFPEDYLYRIYETYMGTPIELTRTLSLLKMRHPNKDYTFEEVQKYAVLYSLTTGLRDLTELFNRTVDQLLSIDDDIFDDEESSFDPSKINDRESSAKQAPAQKIVTNVAPIDTDAKPEDYLAEIAELRKKLNRKEQEVSQLREETKILKLHHKEAESLVEKYESEREELIALRNFAYKASLDDNDIATIDKDQMISAISDLEIVIIGGHVNWINKLKKQFPKWMFIDPDAYKTVDGKMLDSKAKVYFYTDYLSHITYNKFIAAVRERNIQFGYLASVNIDYVTRHIYEDIGQG